MSLLGHFFSLATLRPLALPAIAAFVALPFARGLRGYSWPQALVTAAAVGALVYAGRRSIEHARAANAAHRLPAPPESATGRLAEASVGFPADIVTPRPDEEREGEEQVNPSACNPTDKE